MTNRRTLSLLAAGFLAGSVVCFAGMSAAMTSRPDTAKAEPAPHAFTVSMFEIVQSLAAPTPFDQPIERTVRLSDGSIHTLSFTPVQQYGVPQVALRDTQNGVIKESIMGRNATYTHRKLLVRLQDLHEMHQDMCITSDRLRQDPDCARHRDQTALQPAPTPPQ